MRHLFIASIRRVALIALVVFAATVPLLADDATPFDPPQARINPPIGSQSGVAAVLSFVDVLRVCLPFTLLP